MPLKNGPSTRRRLIPAALTALALPLAAGGIATAPAGAASMAAMAGMSAMTSRPSTPAATRASMFHVGSPTHPLMEAGPAGPLWSASPASIPGRASHGTFGAIYVAGQLAKLAAERELAAGIVDPNVIHATGASASTVLTSAQATKQLSKKCQKLIKAKPSSLSKADRKRRTKCIAQRSALIAASKKAASGTTTASPTSTPMPAPAAPIQGPSPTTTSGGTPTPTPTPTPSPTTSSGIDPSTVVCSAVGVTAIDIQPFGLTRGVACTSSTGSVNFQFTNQDSQTHGVAIKAAGADDSDAVVIVGSLAKQSGPVSKNVALSPGDYTLLCTIPSHNVTTDHQTSMEVPLKILTKADYIAQGYAVG